MNYKIFEQIGLNNKEIKVYLSALELGESTVYPISKKADIKRTYCYDILDDLQKKSLVFYIEKNGRRRYIAEDPKKIKEMLKTRLSDFEAVLPNLTTIYNQAPQKPKIRYFEGKEEVISIYEILLKTKEISAIASPAKIYEYIGDYFEGFSGKLHAKNTKIKELITFNSPVVGYLKWYKKPNQEFRILPKEMKISTDMILFDNKLAMISFGKKIHAVLIEDSAIVETQKAMFDVIWNASKSTK
ncbi:MAG: helix-turn-helix domain-containing protein [Patescibacteria group bacterium]